MQEVFRVFEAAIITYRKSFPDTRVVVILDDIPITSSKELSMIIGQMLNLYTQGLISVYYIASDYQGVDIIQKGISRFIV